MSVRPESDVSSFAVSTRVHRYATPQPRTHGATDFGCIPIACCILFDKVHDMCPGSPSVFEPASVCASRLPPGPPVSFYRLSRVCPVCVPAHHGVFLHPRCLFTGTVPVCVVVRFVRVIRLPACARVSRVSRVCPGSPRCLFTGARVSCPWLRFHVLYRYCLSRVCPGSPRCLFTGTVLYR